VTPLREGGSLPGLVEASDDGLYVAKFRGAGQGPKALVAEIIAGELGRALGLRIPDLVLMGIDPQLASAEPDEEIQDLLAASEGLNLGVDFLPGALPFSPAVGPVPDPADAADILWFDAFITNVDRTARNPNLLTWHGQLWLIDHGASLYFHHAPERVPNEERNAFPAIAEHVLLPYAGSILAADERLAARITPALIDQVLEAVPLEWVDQPTKPDDGGVQLYRTFLTGRSQEPRPFVAEAERARAAR